jgi:hypothetical protein
MWFVLIDVNVSKKVKSGKQSGKHLPHLLHLFDFRKHQQKVETIINRALYKNGVQSGTESVVPAGSR